VSQSQDSVAVDTLIAYLAETSGVEQTERGGVARLQGDVDPCLRRLDIMSTACSPISAGDVP
jgi:hypothetical protein